MRFVDSLKLFKIGYSWGGVTSLVMAYESLGRSNRNYGRQLVRLNIGLEEPQDLIADLEQALLRRIYNHDCNERLPERIIDLDPGAALRTWPSRPGNSSARRQEPGRRCCLRRHGRGRRTHRLQGVVRIGEGRRTTNLASSKTKKSARGAMVRFPPPSPRPDRRYEAHVERPAGRSVSGRQCVAACPTMSRVPLPLHPVALHGKNRVGEAVAESDAHVKIDAPSKPTSASSPASWKRLRDLVVVVLDRPGHQTIIDTLRTVGCRVRVISDGDVAAAIVPSCRFRRRQVHRHRRQPRAVHFRRPPSSARRSATCRCGRGRRRKARPARQTGCGTRTAQGLDGRNDGPRRACNLRRHRHQRIADAPGIAYRDRPLRHTLDLTRPQPAPVRRSRPTTTSPAKRSACIPPGRRCRWNEHFINDGLHPISRTAKYYKLSVHPELSATKTNMDIHRSITISANLRHLRTKKDCGYGDPRTTP